MGLLLVILITIFLVIIAVPIVYFLSKKIGHGIKHLFFSIIICIMLTSMIQLGIFYLVMKLRIFAILCEYGFNCNSLFSGFLYISIYSSIAIFSIIISVYYLFKILKGLFKIGIIILGIALIVIACIAVFKSYAPQESDIRNISYCTNLEDCAIIQENENISSININYLNSENIPNESLNCIYYPTCINNQCGIELRENSSLCEI